jgi:hypothetical protein
MRNEEAIASPVTSPHIGYYTHMNIAPVALLALTFTPAAKYHEVARREDHDGWTIVHLRGTPQEIGVQHGTILSKEISESIKSVEILLQEETKKDWQWYRETSHRLFWKKLDQEYRDEIQGIAQGASSQGAKVDADDILALNSYIEVSEYYLPVLKAREKHAQVVSSAPLACSAFVATGSETKDGKVLMGHNFWWDYVTGEHWNIVFDVKPTHGRRFMMDAMAGLIESGTDWAVNDAGIAFCETTISGFSGFDENGLPEFMRMRKAIQYSSSLDDVARIFKKGNNGGYANTWLMADAKNNEIGKLELGLKNVTFERTKDGYYVGSNFPENPKLIAEEASSYHGGGCEDRRQRWIKDMEANKGKIDAEMAKTFLQDTYNEKTKANDGLGGGALCGKGDFGGAINTKVISAEMLKQMRFWARMGPSDGSDILVAPLKQKYTFIAAFGDHYRDVKGQPWTVVSAD